MITSSPIVFEPEANARGADLIPVVNAFANSLNTFNNDYDVNLQLTGVNMFPGYEWCNDFNPHSKWHQVKMRGLI